MDIGILARALVVDFEAVPGAGGRPFPVEVGIAAGTRVGAAHVRPLPGWLPARPACPMQAAALARAEAEGEDPARVARWLLRAAAGRALLSDACFLDQPLLDRLIGAASATPPRLAPFFPAVEACAEAAGIGRGELNAWIVEIDAGRGEAHRAGEDARVRAALVARVAARAARAG